MRNETVVATATAVVGWAIGMLTACFIIKGTSVTISVEPRIAACNRELALVKVTLDTARSLSRHHADSEPYQYKAGGQMETMFRVCFADPDRDTPESPGMLAAKLGDLTEAEIAQVEAELDEGWRASTIGQPWRGAS